MFIVKKNVELKLSGEIPFRPFGKDFKSSYFNILQLSQPMPLKGLYREGKVGTFPLSYSFIL